MKSSATMNWQWTLTNPYMIPEQFPKVIERLEARLLLVLRAVLHILAISRQLNMTKKLQTPVKWCVQTSWCVKWGISETLLSFLQGKTKINIKYPLIKFANVHFNHGCFFKWWVFFLNIMDCTVHTFWLGQCIFILKHKKPPSTYNHWQHFTFSIGRSMLLAAGEHWNTLVQCQCCICSKYKYKLIVSI